MWRRVLVELDEDFGTAVAKYEHAMPTHRTDRFLQCCAAHAPAADRWGPGQI